MDERAKNPTANASDGRESGEPADLSASPAPEPDLAPSFGFEEDIDAWVRRVASAAREASQEDLGSIAGFRLLSVVARGGQGTVYRAIEPGTERVVAIKRLHTADVGSSARARFDREAEVVAGLRHPGIVTLLSRLDAGEQRILVMQWIDGSPVDRWADDRRAAGGRESLRTIVLTIASLADAVAHAHRNGVIHRDLKPSNVLVDAEGAPHVLDFGLALPDGPDVTTITIGSGFLGTPSYAAPEQVAGRHVDSRSDVHAVGALLYRAITGTHPFDDRAPLPELFRQITEIDPTPPSRVLPSIGRELSLVCMKALAKEPGRRYETMEALAADLRRWLADEPVLAHPAEFGYVLRKSIARHRVAFLVAAVAVVLLVAASVISTSLALSLAAEREKLEDARTEEQFAKVAAEAGAIEATRRAQEAEEAKESAERTRDFLQGIFTAMRESGAEDARNTALGALEIARRMLSLEDRPPSVEAELRETLAAAFDELGEIGAALNEYRRSESLLLASADPDPDLLARTRFGAAKQLLALERPAEAIPALEASLAWHRTNGNDAAAADSLRSLAMAKKTLLGPLGALPLAEESLELALRSEDALRVGSALSTLSLMQEELGFPDRAFATSRESVACLRERVDPRHPELARALHNHAYIGLLVRRWDESADAAREAISIRDANYGHQSTASQGTMSVLIRAMRGSGGLEEAIELGRRAIVEQGVATSPYLRSLGLVYYWLRLLEERGWPEDLQEVVERTRIAIDRRLAVGDFSSSRVIELVRLRARVLFRERGVDAIRSMLREEPERWQGLVSERESPALFATYATLLGIAEARGFPPGELLGEAERLCARMRPLLAENSPELVSLLRMVAEARELGADWSRAAIAYREAIAVASIRQGDAAPLVRSLRRGLTRVEATLGATHERRSPRPSAR